MIDPGHVDGQVPNESRYGRALIFLTSAAYQLRCDDGRKRDRPLEEAILEGLRRPAG